MLINIRRDQWRKNSVRDRHDQAAFRRSQLASGGGDPEAALIARTAVWQALDILPPRRRAIVVMYELEGLAIPAIASLLGLARLRFVGICRWGGTTWRAHLSSLGGPQ